MKKPEKSITETVREVNLTPRQIKNFWRKIKKGEKPDDCWDWLGYKDKNGYGRCGVAGRKVALVHRVSYVIANGEPPGDKPFILHSCDTPGCSNPRHLFPGTQADNVEDMKKKGRGNQWAHTTRPEDFQGENNGNSSTNRNDVIRMREMREGGCSLIFIAETFKMSIPGVHSIVTRKTWKHVA